MKFTGSPYNFANSSGELIAYSDNADDAELSDVLTKDDSNRDKVSLSIVGDEPLEFKGTTVGLDKELGARICNYNSITDNCLGLVGNNSNGYKISTTINLKIKMLLLQLY